MEHIEKKAKESIQEADESAEPNPWLKLKEKNPERLRAAIEPPPSVTTLSVVTGQDRSLRMPN
jgi:hypothetical protein